jgi:hypothetical protein
LEGRTRRTRRRRLLKRLQIRNGEFGMTERKEDTNTKHRYESSIELEQRRIRGTRRTERKTMKEVRD